MTDSWKEKLTPEQYHVLREKGTDPPFVNKYYHHHETGMFHCAGCGEELFASGTKFDSGSGWPSFSDPVNLEKVELVADDSNGMDRIEVRCKNCGGHLGHLFYDGPTPTGERYCINSTSLEFKKS